MRLRWITVLLFCLVSAKAALGCSCGAITFCNFLESEEAIAAFRGEVVGFTSLESVPFGKSEHFLSVRIIKRYKDVVNMSDTIRIYGRENEASCSVNFGKYKVGSTVIFAIGSYSLNHLIENPDSLSNDQWEWHPHLCYFTSLRLEEDNVVGKIGQDVFSYPLENFEEGLANCNFPYIGMNTEDCTQQQWTVYPNPTLDGNVYLEASNISETIQEVAVFNTAASLWSTNVTIEQILRDKIRLTGLPNGLNYIRLKIGEKECIVKTIALE